MNAFAEPEPTFELIDAVNTVYRDFAADNAKIEALFVACQTSPNPGLSNGALYDFASELGIAVNGGEQ
ncbi:hypothetical protein [Streptomyces lydicus]|uniref:hypothetical protein n=1 Tax=Streptomyces lydicus TaxID=47763 RepID=UPI0037FC913A